MEQIVEKKLKLGLKLDLLFTRDGAYHLSDISLEKQDLIQIKEKYLREAVLFNVLPDSIMVDIYSFKEDINKKGRGIVYIDTTIPVPEQWKIPENFDSNNSCIDDFGENVCLVFAVEYVKLDGEKMRIIL